MKKFISIIMLVCIVASVCTVNAWADTGTVTMSGQTYLTLAAAIGDAPATGGVIELSEGEYTFAEIDGKTLTIQAASGADRTKVKVNANFVTGVGNDGGSITFSGVTIIAANIDYTGIQHISSFTANNCVIENEFWSYALTASFTGCTFSQPRADKYNIWTYNSTNISFTNCQFNSAGKSMLVYHEGPSTKTVNVSGCMFNNIASSAVAGKAAIEMDSTYHPIILNIDTQTAASGFDANSLCGNQLWNEKKTGTANNYATVTVGTTRVRTQGQNTTTIDPNTSAPANNNPPVDPNPGPGVNPNPNPTPVVPAAPVVENVYFIPSTDDNSNMALWSILALALLTTAFVTRKRKTEN